MDGHTETLAGPSAAPLLTRIMSGPTDVWQARDTTTSAVCKPRCSASGADTMMSGTHIVTEPLRGRTTVC